MHDKVQSTAPFSELSERLFPKGHPMFGALLVGPTEPADDMFLEPEPIWALDTVVSVRGPVDADTHLADIDAAFRDAFTPTKSASFAKAGRTTVGASERRVLVGWSSPPPSAANQTAVHLAFMLACHNRMGRIHRALRHDKSIAGRLNCSLEIAPQTSVAWVFAMPNMPYSIADAEKEIERAVSELATEGPTAAELLAARGLLRTELARERESATIRGLPKSWVALHNETILAGLDRVTKADVIDAAKVLFHKDRRVVVVSD
jgi:predicted Zn-dependent peptidase